MAGDDGDRLAALRSELRALGYLEGRLERWLLRDLVREPGRLAPALRTSLRAAALGGPLVASAIVVALVLWHPALARRATDLVVLSGYVLGLAFLADLG